ncbi:MAG: hypothetical protein KGQ42_11005, partial [Alphaproteobacteria bacterium]|nr:hypothetical protein [Alphaproteobacteria bacterium]
APGQSAAALFPQAAQANKPVFYGADGTALSLSQVYQALALRIRNTSAPAPISGLNSASNFDLSPAQSNNSTLSIPPADEATPAATTTDAEQLAQFNFAPIPKQISLDYAQATYSKLAALEGGDAA